MSAALRARPEDLLGRFPLRLVPPASGQLESHEVEVCGRSGQLTVERIGEGRVRATVSVRTEGSRFGQALTLGREVAAAAHALAREAVERFGRAESAGIWGVGFTVEGTCTA